MCGLIVAAAGERPADARDGARAALHETLDERREGLVVDQRGQHVDEGDGRVLVGLGQGAEDGVDGAGAEALELFDGLLRGGARRGRSTSGSP